MSIRLGNSCGNCGNITDLKICEIHGVKVSDSYTCDSFEMKAILRNDTNCTTCAKYQEPSCANPQKAAPEMLCSHWAPQSVAV